MEPRHGIGIDGGFCQIHRTTKAKEGKKGAREEASAII
jgi:translation elongation factor P/translation initiation factor 5A